METSRLYSSDRPRPPARIGSRRLLLVLALLGLIDLTGCRELLDSGRTIGEEDVLRGRPAARGGPELSPAELAQGWVALEAGDADELRDALQDRIQASIDLLIDRRLATHRRRERRWAGRSSSSVAVLHTPARAGRRWAALCEQGRRKASQGAPASLSHE